MPSHGSRAACEPRPHALEVAERVAARLAAVEGVAGVTLGGSWARGGAGPGSDVDLGVYYRSARRPSIARLRRLAAELDDRRADDLLTDFGGWGRWIDGGGWLTIEGQAVDWLYRDLDRVERILAECRRGRVTTDYQRGHPHGFHSHIYLGELHLGRVLADPGGELARLKRAVGRYPPALRRTLVARFLEETAFALATGEKGVERADVAYVVGSLFRCAACLVQVLFALNRRYVVNEKGAVAAAAVLPLCPPSFTAEVTDVLGAPGRAPIELRAAVGRFAALVETTRRLCGDLS